jgi:hypothetical protein
LAQNSLLPFHSSRAASIMLPTKRYVFMAVIQGGSLPVNGYRSLVNLCS